MKFKNIKGADQLIEELKSHLSELEQNISELNAHKKQLEESVHAMGTSRFDVAGMKASKFAQEEINLVDETLLQAEVERGEIIKSISKYAYENVQKILNEYVGSIRNTKMEENAQMIQKIHEIREIFKRMVQADREVVSEINDFIKEVDKFVDDEPIVKGGHVSLNSMLSQLRRTNFYDNKLAVLDVFNEADYSISGLLSQKHQPSHHELESDLKYGVNAVN